MNFKQLGANLGLEEDEYKELIELFVESGGTDFEQLKKALAAGDADTVMRCAHTLKGASGNLGLEKISDVARVIEESAMNNELSQLDASVQRLSSLIEVVRAFINN